MTTARVVNWSWRLPREPVSIRVAALLTDFGHDALHVTDCDLAGEPDERVLACAVEDGRVLLSADTGFGGMLAGSGRERSASCSSAVRIDPRFICPPY